MQGIDFHLGFFVSGESMMMMMAAKKVFAFLFPSFSGAEVVNDAAEAARLLLLRHYFDSFRRICPPLKFVLL